MAKKLPQSWNSRGYVARERKYQKLLREAVDASYPETWKPLSDPHIGQPNKDFVNLWGEVEEKPHTFFNREALMKCMTNTEDLPRLHPSLLLNADGSIDFRSMSLVNPPGRDVNLGVKQFWLMQVIRNEDGTINEERAKEVAEQMKREYPWDLECSFSDNNEFLAGILAANPSIEEDRAKRISEGAQANQDALTADLERCTEIMESDQSTASTPDPSSTAAGKFDWAGLRKSLEHLHLPTIRNKTITVRMPHPDEVPCVIMGSTSPGIYALGDSYLAMTKAYLEDPSTKTKALYYQNSKRKGEKIDESKASENNDSQERSQGESPANDAGTSQTD